MFIILKKSSFVKLILLKNLAIKPSLFNDYSLNNDTVNGSSIVVHFCLLNYTYTCCFKDNLGGPKSEIGAFWSESLGGFLVDEESTKKNTVSLK